MTRTAIRERLTPEFRKAFEDYVVHHGAIHDDDCPGDDTCECSGKRMNDAANEVCRLLDALAEPPAQPEPTEDESHGLRTHEWAARNCHMLARREIRRLNRLQDERRNEGPPTSIEAWQHVLRICELSGVQGDGVLRDADPPVLTPGTERLRQWLDENVTHMARVRAADAVRVVSERDSLQAQWVAGHSAGRYEALCEVQGRLGESGERPPSPDSMVLAAKAGVQMAIDRLKQAMASTARNGIMPLNAQECVTILEHFEIPTTLPVAENAPANLRAPGGAAEDWRQIVLALWGDPEDCADCLDLSERPCAVHANIELGRKLAESPRPPAPPREPRRPFQDELFDLIKLMPDSQTQEIVDYIAALREIRSKPAPPPKET